MTGISVIMVLFILSTGMMGKKLFRVATLIAGLALLIYVIISDLDIRSWQMELATSVLAIVTALFILHYALTRSAVKKH